MFLIFRLWTVILPLYVPHCDLLFTEIFIIGIIIIIITSHITIFFSF